jgi:hypothetical protein
LLNSRRFYLIEEGKKINNQKGTRVLTRSPPLVPSSIALGMSFAVFFLRRIAISVKSIWTISLVGNVE